VRKRETKLQVPHPRKHQIREVNHRDTETRRPGSESGGTATKRHDNTRKEDAVTMATEERREGR
jgi:hypothetical protein